MTTRTLTQINLAGIVLLTLCIAFQWWTAHHLGWQIRTLKRACVFNEEQIATQGKTIAGLNDDLERHRTRLATLRATLQNAEQENKALAAENARLRSNNEVWKQAVQERDTQLRQAAASINELNKALAERVREYNELARAHNERVTDLNAARQKLAEAYKDLDDARRQLYKALGKPVPPPPTP
jgi:chromosome segregation ATPase